MKPCTAADVHVEAVESPFRSSMDAIEIIGPLKTRSTGRSPGGEWSRDPRKLPMSPRNGVFLYSR